MPPINRLFTAGMFGYFRGGVAFNTVATHADHFV
jgi:hypothetical protein